MWQQLRFKEPGSFHKKGDERHKFANIVNAAIKIARAFRYYKMRKNKKIILYKSGTTATGKISYYIDSDSSASQDESEDEEDYLHDYDTGCFIRLPRKAYAAQKIQSCVRGYMVRKKMRRTIYTCKIGTNLYSEILARISSKITCKTTASNAVSKLVVDISDNDSWENQLDTYTK